MFSSMVDAHQIEIATIGRILAGYTEIEFQLLMCVVAVTEDVDSAVKALYRTRGESQRIEIADALCRQRIKALDMGGDYENAIGAMHHCKKIRNQYSHCHWVSRGCKKFCVNGHLAGNCRPSRRYDDRSKTYEATEAECRVDAVG